MWFVNLFASIMKKLLSLLYILVTTLVTEHFRAVIQMLCHSSNLDKGNKPLFDSVNLMANARHIAVGKILID